MMAVPIADVLGLEPVFASLVLKMVSTLRERGARVVVLVGRLRAANLDEEPLRQYSTGSSSGCRRRAYL
jgi:hypothetical protein